MDMQRSKSEQGLNITEDMKHRNNSSLLKVRFVQGHWGVHIPAVPVVVAFINNCISNLVNGLITLRDTDSDPNLGYSAKRGYSNNWGSESE